MIRNYKFIDLFAGCGGLSEGFYRKGYKALLHLEIDKAACKTLSTRMKHYGYSEQEIEEAVMCDDITREGLISDMDKRIHESVDIIIGGPPCQAFSSVGRAQSPDTDRPNRKEQSWFCEIRGNYHEDCGYSCFYSGAFQYFF